jgi:hypothetical protein
MALDLDVLNRLIRNTRVTMGMDSLEELLDENNLSTFKDILSEEIRDAQGDAEDFQAAIAQTRNKIKAKMLSKRELTKEEVDRTLRSLAPEDTKPAKELFTSDPDAVTVKQTEAEMSRAKRLAEIEAKASAEADAAVEAEIRAAKAAKVKPVPQPGAVPPTSPRPRVTPAVPAEVAKTVAPGPRPKAKKPKMAVPEAPPGIFGPNGEVLDPVKLKEWQTQLAQQEQTQKGMFQASQEVRNTSARPEAQAQFQKARGQKTPMKYKRAYKGVFALEQGPPTGTSPPPSTPFVPSGAGLAKYDPELAKAQKALTVAKEGAGVAAKASKWSKVAKVGGTAILAPFLAEQGASMLNKVFRPNLEHQREMERLKLEGERQRSLIGSQLEIQQLERRNEELVQRKAMMLAEKEPSLAQILMGLPAMTPNETIIGAKPRTDTIKQYAKLDAQANGELLKPGPFDMPQVGVSAFDGESQLGGL